MNAFLLRLSRSPWLTPLIALLYLLLSVLMTWPAAARLGTAYAGARSDLWVHQWTFWWVREALATGQSPFFTDLLYFPQGVSLTSHNIAWTNIAAWLPLQALLGEVAAYNILFVAIFALNGFAFYLFAREATGRPAPAFLGGVIFGFWPYTLSHYDHPNMIAVFWVPLTLLFARRALRRGSVPYALLAGVCLALVGITRWQLLVMAAPLLLGYLLYELWRAGSAAAAFPWRSLALLLLTGGLAFLLMAPLAAPLVLDQLGRSGPEAVAVAETELPLTDLLAYVMPPDLYPLLFPEVPAQLPYPGWEPYHTISASTYYVPFIGLLTLLLALYGLLRAWSKTWPWLLLALAIMLMALGPQLAINGRLYPTIPMPYRLIEGGLLDVLIRRPHRLNIFLSFPVAMIATWGAVDLLQRVRARVPTGQGAVAATAVTAGLAALILWENPVPPIPSTVTSIPAWYQRLADEPGDFGILQIPFHNRGFDKLYMVYQTAHGKPIMTGHVSRLPQEAFTFIESVPFLEPLNSIYTWDVVEESWVDPQVRDITRQLGLLSEAGVRYVVLDKPLVPPGYLERWRDWVTFDPVYEDDEVLVYLTAPQAGREFVIAAELAPGLGLIRSACTPEEAVQGGVLKADLRWGTAVPPAQDYEVCFTLQDAQGAAALTTCHDLIPGWPTSTWGANAVARGAYVLPLAADFPPGDYTLAVTLAAGGAAVGETAVLGPVTVLPFDPQQQTALNWESGLALRGYSASQDDDALTLSLFWQADAPLPQSYKRFVHLVDPASGAVLAQSDGVPRDWTYPTNIWEAGEVVRETAVLPLAGLPPGRYDLRLGWYAEDGGAPLGACATAACDAPYHALPAQVELAP